MSINQLKTVEELEQFLLGTQPVAFCIEGNVSAVYQWVQKTLVSFEYLKQKKCVKGIITQYLIKITGYSRQQIVRLIQQYRETGMVLLHYQTEHQFNKKYTSKDIRLLAQLDTWHQTLSGPATKKLCERAVICFGQTEYENLANISVSHLYNLRQSISYTRQRQCYEKTKYKTSTIGIRRKPIPNGLPGYIRIDTVHQGDFDNHKGVYHINAVDEVTQFEIVCTVEKISEQYLIPVLEELLNAFPFVVLNFHSDNGFEYVNQYVVRLLQKLLIEFTKSRARHSNDNALVESKNGSIVRKLLGYTHIPQHFADQVNTFNRLYLNPYINYHRPCFFAETVIDQKGEERKKYPYKAMMTPYEKLKSLPNAATHLKPGISFSCLDKIAMQISDNEAARLLQETRNRLFTIIYEQKQAT